MADERIIDNFYAVFCEKHGGLKKVVSRAAKFDFKDGLVKLMLTLECGCEVWGATYDEDSEPEPKEPYPTYDEDEDSEPDPVKPH